MTVVRAVLGEAPQIAIAAREGYIAVTPTGTAGPAGPATQWRFAGGYLQTRPVDLSADWTNVVAITDITGPMPEHEWSGTSLRFETTAGVWGAFVDLKGDALEMRVSGGYIQWRPVGGGAWTNIVALSSLVGPQGPAIEMQKTATHVQWRVVGAPTWINLVALADITGPQGNPGPYGLSIPLGAWSNATTYAARDVVNWNGSSYVCLVGHTNQAPPTPPGVANTYWFQLAAKGDTPTTVDVSNVAGLPSELLGTAHAAVTVTASDIVWEAIYDTSLDSDKGAWRHRCAHTSWWQEPLNTATRGRKREFPQKAKLVLRSAASAPLVNALVIYDLTDLDTGGAPRMWMSFTGGGTRSLWGGTGTFSAVTALNGRLWVGTPGASGGLSIVDFVTDETRLMINSSTKYYPRPIAGRNDLSSVQISGGWLAGLASRDVNHVHARVFPGAPLDYLGLPIPKVAVATAGGLSVIHEDGAVYDVTVASGYSRSQLSDGRIACSRAGSDIVEYGPVPYADVANTSWRTMTIRAKSLGAADLSAPLGTATALAGDAIGSSVGFCYVAPDIGAPPAGMVAYSATGYATGWQVGDIRLSALCDSTTGNVTGGTVPDRSYKAGTLSVVGTLTRAAVATGCDLAAFSGFSGSSYLEQPYSADLDFGTGDFSVVLWANIAAINSTKHLVWRRKADNSGPFLIIREFGSGPTLQAVISDGSTSASLGAAGNYTPGGWTHIVLTRRAGVLELWINGQRQETVTSGQNISAAAADAILRLGAGASGVDSLSGSLSLVRFSATAPTAAQIARMYRDEAPLFRPSAKAMLGGAANAVSAMDFDSWSGRLLVGTGDGVSEFAGLSRVGYFDTSNTPLTNDTMRAVACQGGYRAMAGGAQSIVVRDKVSPHDVVNAYPEQPPAWLTDEIAAIRALSLLGIAS